jgi:hydrogenase maturation protein HypF
VRATAEPTRRVRRAYDIRGVVQGVGFRPTIHRLATEARLAGWVQNRAGVVRLALEGEPAAIERFLTDLPAQLPPAARIESIAPAPDADLSGPLHGFRIVASETGGQPSVLIPTDLALCADCEAEILDPAGRRHGYAFTTCTNCGPRYTVVNAMPYDRARTTMAAFPLCPACAREYADPADRRFHAETIACPACGPRLWLLDGEGRRMDEGDPLRAARRALAAGELVAVRGIGGFLLAADALQPDALRRLRERKRRPHKPLAVMARDLVTLRRYCDVPPAAEAALRSAATPIVILDVLPDALAAGRLPLDLLTPDACTLGAMLPTSPLHRLLAEPLPGDPTPAFDLLVMTSGNRRGEPIALTNEEALDRLRGIADRFLCHDREINLRNDDSLCALQRDAPQVWRRARGYAPSPVVLAHPLTRPVLAMGAELKNAIALGYGNRVVLSPHVGDLDTPEAVRSLEQVANTLPCFLAREPSAVAVDLHPDMQSARLGRRIAAARGLPVVAVQHHHAHAAACLAEHGRDAGLALCFDGTGLGADGAIWGAELLEVRADGSYRRLATFRPAPLPGGDAAIRQPIRQLVARWLDAGATPPADRLAAAGVTRDECDAWALQCRRGLNAPLTHAAGRLFDSFATLLGLAPAAMTYDGQPAIRLEAAARRHAGGPPPKLNAFRAEEREGLLVVDWRPLFALDRDLVRLGDPAALAVAFHAAVAAAAERMVSYALQCTAWRAVALSGGVFMNRVLNDLLAVRLERLGVELLLHRQTPPNDGGIALGQAVVAGTEGE